MKIERLKSGFAVYEGETLLLQHTAEQPMLFVGCGDPEIDMYRGNFKIDDYVIERRPLRQAEVELTETGCKVEFENMVTAEFVLEGCVLTVRFACSDPAVNRFWLRLPADVQERCYGCGEQMSYFNLRGRNYPIWTSEPGVGRDKTTFVTWRSDVENKASSQ